MFLGEYSSNTEEAEKNIQHHIARLKRMDEMLYDDKLTGEISPERYQKKHETFVSEIKELEKQKGSISQEYKKKYLEGVTVIELTQTAKARFWTKKSIWTINARF